MSKLISIIYASAAVNLFSDDDLVELLKSSRENNIKEGITGLLLYKDGNFIQAMEGPEEAVNQLYKKIQDDNRHHHITLLGNQPIAERQFPNWLMGFKDVDNLSPEEVEGFSTFMSEDFTPEYFQENPIRAYIMLMSFKESM